MAFREGVAGRASWKGRSACRRVLRHGTCNPVETNAVVVNTASETTNLQQVLLFKIELKLSELKTIRTRNEPKILSKLELSSARQDADLYK